MGARRRSNRRCLTSVAARHPYFDLRARVDSRHDMVVTLAGELDHHAGKWLAAQSASVVAAARDAASEVAVIDVGAISFLDCSGLRALLSLIDQFDAVRVSVGLRSPSRAVCRVLDLVDVGDRCRIESAMGAR